MKTNKLIPSVLFILGFFSIFVIAKMTPMQSDDFAYALQGLTIHDHWANYVLWSSHIIADYISALLLATDNITLQAFFKSFAAICLVFLITLIPQTKQAQKKLGICFIFIFCLYWVSNPSLGQTLFWTVGAANYLFTTLIAAIYIYFLTQYISHKKYFLWLAVFSLLAGASNGNISFIILLISITTSLSCYINRHEKRLFISTVLVFFGFLTLILSPGNFVKFSHPDFIQWAQLDLSGKIEFFVSNSLPLAIDKTKIAALTALFLLAVALPVRRYNRNAYTNACLLLVAGYVSIFSMVLSPTFPPKEMAGPIFFMLLSSSFALNLIVTNINKVRKIIVTITTLVLLSLFVYSYTQILYSSSRISKQNQIRQNAINDALENGKKSLNIPNYYWPTSFSKDDSPDLFYNQDKASKYFKVGEMNTYTPEYDYSVLDDGQRFDSQIALNDDIHVTHIYLGKDGLLEGSSLILELAPDTQTSSVPMQIQVFNNVGHAETIKPQPDKPDNNFRVDSVNRKKVIGFTSQYKPSEIRSIHIDQHLFEFNSGN